MVEVAHRFGIQTQLLPVPSIALGSQGVGVLELTGAYTVFANGGNSVVPHVIQSITTRDGRTLSYAPG